LLLCSNGFWSRLPPIENGLTWEVILRAGLNVSSKLKIFVHLDRNAEPDKSNPMINATMYRGWPVPASPPHLSYSTKAFLFMFGAEAAAVRWFVVVCCLAAFLLPGAVPSEGGGGDDIGSGGARSPIVDSLSLVCGSVEGLGDSFVDPVSGLVTVM
jgi:hypothetical protein